MLSRVRGLLGPGDGAFAICTVDRAVVAIPGRAGGSGSPDSRDLHAFGAGIDLYIIHLRTPPRQNPVGYTVSNVSHPLYHVTYGGELSISTSGTEQAASDRAGVRGYDACDACGKDTH